MAEVYIAAAPEDGAKARGLAEALAKLGFAAEGGAPAEGEFAAIAENAKCVVTLWSRASASAPWLAALAALSLSRNTLVCAALDAGVSPAPFSAAPQINLAARNRAGFKAGFEALVLATDKLTPTTPNADALLDALAGARAALLREAPASTGPRLATWGVFAACVALLFAVGFGAGRVISAVRSGEFLVAADAANATPTATPTAAPTPAPTPAAAPPRQAPPLPLRAARLEREPWRDVARAMTAPVAAQIQDRARAGDAEAQTLACLGHMAGAPGFLPSPTAARAQCDAASEQNFAAGLYLSWALHRSAPHAGLGEVNARARLSQAAQRGFSAAQIDYALITNDQTEAGRLLLAAAEQNDPRGQYEYARWLRDSAAGPRDPVAALPFLDRAAQAGQLDALHMLATLHRDGIGAPRDPTRARALYEQAAQRNYTPSMFNLADMLRGGGAPERAQAIALYQRLACMRDELQIAPMAQRRLRALGARAQC
jgi:TPR repeat protein